VPAIGLLVINQSSCQSSSNIRSKSTGGVFRHLKFIVPLPHRPGVSESGSWPLARKKATAASRSASSFSHFLQPQLIALVNTI
jgi:hypothetical protein